MSDANSEAVGLTTAYNPLNNGPIRVVGRRNGSLMQNSEYNLNVAVDSQIDKAYSDFSDEKMVYAMAGEVMQNVMDYLMRHTQATLESKNIAYRAGLMTFIDPESGLLSGSHIKYLIDEVHHTIRVTLFGEDVLFIAVTPSNQLAIFQIGVGMIDAGVILPIGENK
jgi:hypothetical protein